MDLTGFLSDQDPPEEQVLDEETPEEETEEVDIGEVDPEDLPPEIQEQFKHLQGDYTRKTQAIAEERKQIEELKSKAAIFDQLKEEGILDRLAGTNQPTESNGQEFIPNPYSEVNLSETFDDDTMTGIKAVVHEILNDSVAKAFVPYQQAILQLMDNQSNVEVTRLTDKYPIAKDRMKEIQDVARKSGLSLEQSMLAVIGPEMLNGQAEAPKKKKDPRMTLTKPKTSGPKTGGKLSSQEHLAALIRHAQKNGVGQ